MHYILAAALDLQYMKEYNRSSFPVAAFLMALIVHIEDVQNYISMKARSLNKTYLV